jgi:hypothetical protein
MKEEPFSGPLCYLFHSCPGLTAGLCVFLVGSMKSVSVKKKKKDEFGVEMHLQCDHRDSVQSFSFFVVDLTCTGGGV